MPIRTHIADNIGEVILDHPPVNALDSAGWNELPNIIETLGRNPEVRCVLIRAEEAYRIGAIEKLVPLDKLYEEARAFAAVIASKSRKALVIAKEALNGIEPRDVDHGYRFEQGFTLEMYMHEDSQKSRDAFVENKGAAKF